MENILTALWPVFLLIVAGYILRRSEFIDEGFWLPAEKLSYYLLFPLLLIYKLSNADIGDVPWAEVITGVLVLLSCGTLLLQGVQKVRPVSGPAFTSIYQGGMRFNTYVGLACCAALYGDQGLAIAAVMVGLMIPLLNILCVTMFAIHLGDGEQAGQQVRNVLSSLMRNPLIIGCVLGIGLNVSGLGFPALLASSAAMLASMALPLALILVGAAVQPQVLRSGSLEVLYSSTIKLLLFPLVMAGYTLLFVDDWLVAAVLMLFSAMPTAPSAYILARQLRGDAELMAVIITAQTLMAMLTIPAVLLIFETVW